MAKGDDARVRNQTSSNNSNYNRQQRGLMNTLYGTQNQMAGNYNQAAGGNLGSYDEIMQGYRNILGGTGASGTGGGGGSGGAISLFLADIQKSGIISVTGGEGGTPAITFADEYGPPILGGSGGNGRIHINCVSETLDTFENLSPLSHLTFVAS